MASLSVEDVATFIDEDVERRRPPIGAYWFECGSERQKAAAELLAVECQACIVPLLPKRGFDNANALLSDLADLLDAERANVEGRVVAAEHAGQAIGLVLVSRTRLLEPLISSPVTLPSWFPYAGGTTTSIELIDIASSAYGTLQREAGTILRLQALNYELQGVLIERLRAVHSRNHNQTAKLFGQLLATGERASDFLAAAWEDHGKQSASGFRVVATPSAKGLLGRVVNRVGKCSPEQLPSFGAALFEALEIGDAEAGGLYEPLFAVAMRSTNKEVESAKRLRVSRNAVLTLYWSSQIVTAAAHAGEYGEFHLPAMRSELMDCVSALSSLKTILC